MAYELVSPPQKGSQSAKSPLISSTGDAISFISNAALGGTPGQTGPGDVYVAVRGASGWATHATAPPAQYVYGSGGTGVPFDFTPDLSRWNSVVGTAGEGPLGISTAFQGALSGGWTPISPRLVPVSGTVGAQTVVSARFQGSSADLTHLFFRPGKQGGSTTAAFLAGDPNPDAAGAEANAYVVARRAGGPTLELLARDEAGAVFGGNCGARVGGSGVPQGAVSDQGRRVYFTTRPAQPPTGNCSLANPRRILQRVETPSGPRITEPVDEECAHLTPALPCGPAVAGDDLFQGASLDGGKLYFTTTRRLAATDLDSGAACYQAGAVLTSPGCDLYLYDGDAGEGQRLVQVSAGAGGDPTPGEGAEVLGVTAISGDGSRAYFVARGALTGENGEGKAPAPGEPNLYLHERVPGDPGGRTAFVATLSSDCQQNAGVSFDCILLFEYERNRDATAVPLLAGAPDQVEIGGSGRFLFFGTQAPLTGQDADGGLRDDYRYDAVAESLRCLSCAAGAPDSGLWRVDDHGRTPAVGSVHATYAQDFRWASEDGRKAVFTTAQPLVASDRDGQASSYLWDDGELTPLPGLEPRISQTGAEVAFSTFAQLLPADGDTGQDVYVAREGGGFAEASAPGPCQGEACQGPAAPPRSAIPPSSQTMIGPVNPAVPKATKRAKQRRVKKNRSRKHRGGKHRGRGHRGRKGRRGRRHGATPAARHGAHRAPGQSRKPSGGGR